MNTITSVSRHNFMRVLFCAALFTLHSSFAISSAAAQSFIGYLSHDAVLQAMPQYDSIQVQTDSLRRAYEQEMKRVEDEFNQKYETFLEERSQYPRTILLKRQQELQDLMRRNIDFRNQALKDLREGEQMALKPLRQQLREAIAGVAREKELMVVLNTDNDNTLYLDPDTSVDITGEVLEALGL